MITLTKVGDAIKFTFDDNPLYLNDGTIEVPVNSLSLLIDESNIATFKKSNGDAFLCCSLDELGMTKEQLIQWYKDNMVDEGISPEEVEDIVETATTNLFGYAEYDSQNTRINFKHDANGSVIAWIDASDFVIDGMIDNVEIVTVEGVKYLKITFNTESGKEPILIPLADIFNPDNYYTKTEVDTALSAKANSSDVYTKTATDTLLNDKADKSTTYTKTEVDTALSAKVDVSALDDIQEVIATSLNELENDKANSSDVYNKTATDTLLNDKADKSTTYTKTATDTLLADKLDASAITTSMSSSSTDSQVPSAKAVYDAIGDVETLLSQI